MISKPSIFRIMELYIAWSFYELPSNQVCTDFPGIKHTFGGKLTLPKIALVHYIVSRSAGSSGFLSH